MGILGRSLEMRLAAGQRLHRPVNPRGALCAPADGINDQECGLENHLLMVPKAFQLDTLHQATFREDQLIDVLERNIQSEHTSCGQRGACDSRHTAYTSNNDMYRARKQNE